MFFSVSLSSGPHPKDHHEALWNANPCALESESPVPCEPLLSIPAAPHLDGVPVHDTDHEVPSGYQKPRRDLHSGAYLAGRDHAGQQEVCLLGGPGWTAPSPSQHHPVGPGWEKVGAASCPAPLGSQAGNTCHLPGVQTAVGQGLRAARDEGEGREDALGL